MDTPYVLIALLALPLLAAVVIIAVSRVRRNRGAAVQEPRHRAQTGDAAAQDAQVHPAAVSPVEAGRARRADSAKGSSRD